MSASKKIHIGVVGGSFGTSFFWHEHPDCVVEAVAELNADRRKALVDTYKCGKAYETLDEMLRDPKVDAVAVFTGAPEHFAHSTAALKAGKHVISAVPAALTLEQCEGLLAVVEETGLTYMMAETSYYRQPTILARRMHEEGKFGTIFYTESEYQHAGLDPLFLDASGKRTWRYGSPPMHYPTHCTSFLVGVTGERLTAVSCQGWRSESYFLKDNDYNNPFFSEAALFRTNRGNSFRVNVFWEGAHRGAERAEWYGSKQSLFMQTANGQGPCIVRAQAETETDDAGFTRQLPKFEEIEVPNYFETDILPEAMRHESGHGGSHVFLAHEFINALVQERRPAIDICEALNFTVPGIIAHQSALKDGEYLRVPTYEPKER